jgi:predicted Na+-dependent transporter
VNSFTSICNSINKVLGKAMPVITPSAIVLGFLFSHFFIIFRPFVALLFALLTLSGAMRLTIGSIVQTLKHPLPILVFIVVNHIVLPLLSFGAEKLIFFTDMAVVAGYVLLYSTPTAVSSTIWSQMYGGDMALTLTLIIIDVILAPALTPFTVSFLAGTEVHFDVGGIVVQLILLVVVPTIIAIILNETSKGKIPDIIAPPLAPVAKAAIFLVVAANTAAAAPSVNLKDPKTLVIALLCLAMGVASYLLGKLGAKAARQKREQMASIVMACGMRNISAGATIAIQFFPPAAAVPCLLGIVFQQMMAAILGKIVTK